MKSKHAGNNEDAVDRGILAGAYAAAGFPNKEIAKRLSWSAGQASREVAQCEAEGYIIRQPEYVPGTKPFPANVLEQIQQGPEARSCDDVLRRIAETNHVPPIWNVRVVPSKRWAGKNASADARRKYLCKQIAGDIKKEIGKAKVCAVAWGETLKSLVDSMEAPFPSPHRAIHFVPVRGEPIGTSASISSPSMLARQLDAKFNGGAMPISLVGVPALIPAGFSDEERLAVQKYAERSKDYKKFFVSRGSNLRFDSVITSVGSVGIQANEELDGFGHYTQECINLWGLDKGWLKQNVVGDLAGVFLPRAKNPSKEWDDLMKQWLGINKEDLKNCVQSSSRRTRRPGVIVVAWGGRERAEVIVLAAELGLISQLFVDLELANQIHMLCNEKLANK